MKFEELEQYMDDQLVTQLSEGIFEADKKRSHEKRSRFFGVSVACAALILLVSNYSSVSAAAKGLMVFLFGGTISEEMPEDYFVLKEAVDFGYNGEYRLELAYRNGTDVYAVVTRKNADGINAVSLEINGTVYEDSEYGKGGYTVTEMGADGITERGKSETQCHFTRVPEENQMTFMVDGQRTEVYLTPPERFADDHGAVVETAGTSWVIWPLAPNRSVVGVSLSDIGGNTILNNAETIGLFNPVFIGTSGREYQAEPVGENSHVWKMIDFPEEEITGFRTQGITYTLTDTEYGLLSFTCRAPERNGVTNMEKSLYADELELKVKRVERDGMDHITVFMEPFTNAGELGSGRISIPDSVGYGSALGEDEFILSADFSYHIMEPDGKTIKETVYTFPYETGQEMKLRIEELELHIMGEGKVMFQ